ncbi:MAG TPA: glucose 1-dehydrogenase [Candidatus Acidoferrales bacterium]|nr:glucose 1-dehydrogenase [Candidatus Acidoferrales bacterium]
MARLAGKVAVVTGASKGIGAAIAERLGKEGASVIVNYASSAAQAEAVVKKIQAAGGKAKAVRADVSKREEAKKLIAAAVSEFGKLDILVNNAGTYEFIPLADVTEEHFDHTFNVDVKGVLFTTQAAANVFDGNGGCVVNISSLASVAAAATASVYSAAKAAVDSMTRTLGAELGPKKIRVNSVLPGIVETEGTANMKNFEQFRDMMLPRTPLGRVGTPNDIAGVVAFLVSDDAAWVTGQMIQAAGGLSL